MNTFAYNQNVDRLELSKTGSITDLRFGEKGKFHKAMYTYLPAYFFFQRDLEKRIFTQENLVREKSTGDSPSIIQKESDRPVKAQVAKKSD